MSDTKLTWSSELKADCFCSATDSGRISELIGVGNRPGSRGKEILDMSRAKIVPGDLSKRELEAPPKTRSVLSNDDKVCPYRPFGSMPEVMIWNQRRPIRMRGNSRGITCEIQSIKVIENSVTQTFSAINIHCVTNQGCCVAMPRRRDLPKTSELAPLV